MADVPSGHDLSNYYVREDERVSHRVIRDTDPIGASYDRYLRSSVFVDVRFYSSNLDHQVR